MDNKIQKIKQGVYKTAVISMVVFIITLVLSGVFLTLFINEHQQERTSWLWLGLTVLSGIISLFTFFALIGGFTFLNANKDWKEIQKVRKKAALDWGLFYFVYASRIEKYSDSVEKESK
ncbi:hypothetical protein [Spiroplasma sp. BIUS-1]|uniref:hypothetical protein n=1 Tax=Spiroplasma sp. BIUS-1 TaxID=216964 RepID=UPI001398396F|nr:hypothetical protein [Spiroplasma sp. BIUS-1]QHX36716.1 hypothetical protein SBIUS_v1c04630 [Spiroplasma sp. BIUS-1]